MDALVGDILNGHWLERPHCRLFTLLIESFAHFWFLRGELLMFTDNSELSPIHLSCVSLIFCEGASHHATLDNSLRIVRIKVVAEGLSSCSCCRR